LGEVEATLAVMGGAVGFGTISVVTVLATRDGMPLVLLLLGRYALAGLILLAMSGGIQRLAVGRARAAQLIIVGGIGQTLVSVLSLAALDYISAATLEFLFYTYPAWVALFARLRGTEPITPQKMISLGLALTGVVVMVGMPGSAALNLVGAGLGLTSALIYAVYVPALGRLQRGIDTGAATFYICLGVSIVLGIAGWWRGELSLSQSLAGWGAIAWLAIVSTVIAFHLFLRGLATLGAVRTSIIATVEPFSVAIIGIFILDQPITLPVLIGGGLIATAVLLMNYRR
ncbi:MAG: DMT family transporter, partial [Gemmatimonadaceae bacterium]